MSPQVVIFSDVQGWHEDRLIEAFQKLDVQTHLVSLLDCEFTEDSGYGCLRIPKFEDRLPSAAFVRGIAGGTFEQVTLRLDFLHALTDLSVKVVNSARVIEKSVDKAMTSHLLRYARVATVPAWTTESRDKACKLVDVMRQNNKKLVSKPLFGSRGRGLKLIESVEDIPEVEDVNGVYYLQEFVDSYSGKWRDWRIMVVQSKAISAMERCSDQWITNRSQGADCVAARLEPKVYRLAEQAADAVGADYAGVDVTRDKEGNWKVIEVNGIPAWRGLQEVTEIDIAMNFAKLVMN